MKPLVPLARRLLARNRPRHALAVAARACQRHEPGAAYTRALALAAFAVDGHPGATAALDAALAAVRTAPASEPDAGVLEADLLRRLGRDADARRAVRRAASRHGWSPGLATVAALLAAPADPAGAAALLRRYAGADPTARYNLGLLELRLGHWAAGWRLYDDRFRVPSLRPLLGAGLDAPEPA